MRTSGILMPIFSLPGKYGIGCFSEEAYQFVDFLKRAGQTYWQILPLGPTSYGDSPYQSFSIYAGNPYFIDPDTLAEKGLLTKAELKNEYRTQEIPYDRLYVERFGLLRRAFSRVSLRGRAFHEFAERNAYWLDDYATFMALKDDHNGEAFTKWEDKYRLRDVKALAQYRESHREEIDFYRWVQFEFDVEWRALKSYANLNGIKIIGDIPIYVSHDSSDVWCEPELFQLDKNLEPTAVAGHPPDDFSKTGQLWGNPLYNWNYHRKTGYAWWTSRVKKCLELYDVLRIDHFRGFDEYYSVPAGNPTAEFGTWVPGPGADIFKRLEKNLGEIHIIAEDLGYVTEGVKKLVKETGYPNMKILQTAFEDIVTRDEHGMTWDHIPYNYGHNCVVYTGTHDNDTLVGYINKCKKTVRNNIANYIGADASAGDEELADGLIRLALASVADYCIIPMADYLHLDNSSRINLPGTLGNNWIWRVEKRSISKALADSVYKLTRLYGRLNPETERDEASETTDKKPVTKRAKTAKPASKKGTKAKTAAPKTKATAAKSKEAPKAKATASKTKAAAPKKTKTGTLTQKKPKSK